MPKHPKPQTVPGRPAPRPKPTGAERQTPPPRPVTFTDYASI